MATATLNRRPIWQHLVGGTILFSVLGFPSPALAFLERWLAPDKNLWDVWMANDPAASGQIDHRAWDALLKTHIVPGTDGIHRFAYADVTTADHRSLTAYLDRMAKVSISRHRRSEQFAYWVNIYNALTVKLILDHYPVESIRSINISPGLFSLGPWDKALITIEDRSVTLNDIEHRILRPIWNDPRIHYAVNCASMGCPNLHSEAFTADNTEALLERGARAYVNHPRGVRIADGQLHVSSIYNWFREDFGGSERRIIDHLRRYAKPDLNERLADFRRIDRFAYDWNLNDVAAER